MNNIRFMEIAPDEKHELRMDAQSHFETFEVKDDETLRKKIDNLAHSTYVGHQASNASPLDPKKFIKVGNLTITTDGIANGFVKNTNEVATILTPVTSKNYCITLRNFKYLGGQCFIFGSSRATGFGFAVLGNGNRILLFASNNGTGWNISNGVNSAHSISSGTTYDISFVRENGTAYKVILYNHTTGETTTEINISSSDDINQNNIKIAIGGMSWEDYTGSIDLKQFSVTDEDKLIFSGNKTGIDTIKADDFTISTKIFAYSDGNSHTIYADHDTTPTHLYNNDGSNYTGSDFTIAEGVISYGETECSRNSTDDIILRTVCDRGLKISEDGIASNFDGYSFFTSTITGLTNTSTFKFETVIQMPSTAGREEIILLNPVFGGSFHTRLRFDTQYGNLQLYCYDGTHLGNASYAYENFLGHKVKVTCEVSNAKRKITITRLSDGYSKSSTSSTVLSWNPNSSSVFDLYIGRYAAHSWWTESIDLNATKFWVDDVLVHQGCLKIPYTEAKGNKKIVDKLYRDRVKDLFEQEGYNIYYTLGDDDFTLPSNKPDEIIKYKANGLTVAEQRADQTLTIRGACESGVDVNLPMDFFDGNSYAVFGVGTTGTNTASKFTPAADGNYIAIGKGKV